MKRYKVEIPNCNDLCLGLRREDDDLWLDAVFYSENDVTATEEELIDAGFDWLFELKIEFEVLVEVEDGTRRI